MKLINLILVASVLILLFPANALAAWNNGDNFNDNTFNAWTSNGNHLSIVSTPFPTYLDESLYVTGDGIPPAGSLAYLRKSSLTGLTYWSFSGRESVIGNGQISYRYKNNSASGVDYCVAIISNTGITTGGGGTCAALTNINFIVADGYTPGYWYNIAITDLGTTLKVELSNTTNSTVFKTYTFADLDVAGADSVYIGISASYTTSQGLDNVVASVVAPSTSTLISWDSHSYVNGDIGSFSYTISDADWTDSFAFIPFGFQAEVYKNGVFDKAIDISSQSGNGLYTFVGIGTYEVKLNKYYILTSNSNYVSTDTVLIHESGQSFIQTNATIPVGSQMPFNITFQFGFTPTNPALSGISVNKLADDGNYYQTSFKLLPQFSLTSIVAGTEYHVNMSVYQEGIYEIRLEDFDKGVIARTVAKAKAINYQPTTNLTASYLTIDSPEYIYNDGIHIQYGIDNINYTTHGYQFFLRTYNLNQSTYVGEVNTYQQILDTVYILISPTKPDNKRFGTEIEAGQGNNRLDLVGRNSTTESIISSVFFNISDIDADGYGVSLSKLEVCRNEQFAVTVYSPDPSKLLVLDGSGHNIKNYTINSTSGKVIWTSLNKADTYTFELIKFDYSTIDRDLSVIDCAVPTATGIPPGEAGNQAADAVTTLLTSMTFWAFLMVAGITMYVGWKTKNFIPASITGMTGLGVFTWIGWMPPAIFFSVLAIVAYLLARSQVDKETNVGTQ